MATGATEFVDITTADVFVPEIWSQESVVARQNRLVFAKLVNRVFETELKVGDKVNIPNISNLASRSKTANTAITYETVTETMQTLTVATHDYAAMAVEDIIKVQGNRDLFASYAGKMGYALDLAVDNVLAGLPDDFSQTIGSLASNLTYADLLRGRQYLDDADVPEEDRVIVVSPAEEAGMMQLENFINADYTKGNGAMNGGKGDKGWIGAWLGMPVYKSVNVEGSNAAGHDSVMMHKDALALVLQMKPRFESQRDIDYLVDKVAAQQLHGSKEIRDDHGVWMKSA